MGDGKAREAGAGPGEQFAHLHLHTDYSLLDGCATPETYAKEAARLGQPALAITDHGDMGGCFRFWDACKARGLKPIIGAEVYVNEQRDLHPISKTLQRRIEKAVASAGKRERAVYAEAMDCLGPAPVQDCEAQARSLAKAGTGQLLRDAGVGKGDLRRFRHMKSSRAGAAKEDGVGTSDYQSKDKHLILLAKNEAGFQNLSTIVSEAHVNGFWRKPRTTPEIIRQHSEGLICLTACLGSETSRAIAEGNMDEARRVLAFYREAFKDDLYAELQSNEIPAQKTVDYGLLELADAMGVKRVATVDCHYCYKGDDKMQDALLAKARRTNVNNPDMWKFDARRLWFKSVEETVSEYGELGYSIASSDVRQACATTLEVVDKCDADYFEWGQFQFPEFDTGGEGPDAMLKRLCDEGFAWRLKNGFIDPQRAEEYAERLDREYNIICQKEFSTYFLVVWDMVKWAKDNRIFVGGGRGSVAGSLVAYALRITEVDPLRFGLIFERFLNAGRSGKMLRIEHKEALTPRELTEAPTPRGPRVVSADEHRHRNTVKDGNRVCNSD